MGTTLDDLKAKTGLAVQFIVAIEGYEWLLTDGPTARAITAWAATPWSQCLPGLSINGDFEQQFDPWADSIDVRTLQLMIQADPTEQFAKDTHAPGAGDETRLDAAIDNDATTAAVKDLSLFSSSGTMWIGPERITYSGQDGGSESFTGLTRGTFAPFAKDGSNFIFSRNHQIAKYENDVHVPPDVSTTPREFVGRRIAIWMHRITAGVLDVQAQAQPIFFGTISDFPHEDGISTELACEDVRGRIRDTTLLQNQYKARVADGAYLVEGVTFNIRQRDTISGVTTFRQGAADLVVTTGASGANEVETGNISTEGLIDALNKWLRSEAAAGNLSGEWSVRIGTDADGQLRTHIECIGDANTTQNFIILKTTAHLFRFLGYGQSSFGYITREIQGGDDADLVSDFAPYRVLGFQMNESELILDQVQGDWIDNEQWLPTNLKQEYTESGENWGVIDVGGQLFIAKYSTDQLFTDLHWIPELQRQMGIVRADEQFDVGIRMDVDGEIAIKQIVFLAGSFKDLILRLFASTGTSAGGVGYNHATYDDFAFGLGAGIEWEALGDEFVTSVENLNESDAPRLFMIDKPTRLEDLLMNELILRGANIFWKNGHLEFVTMQSAVSGLETVTLTETNKAEQVGGDIPREMIMSRSSMNLRNIIKIKHSRTFSGEFRDTFEIRDQVSITRYGAHPVEIEARNTWAHITATGDSIAELAGWLRAWLPLFSRPFYIGRRSIDFSLYEDVVPGSIVTVSDDNARNPADGTRGLSGKPGIIIAHRHDWGGKDSAIYGEVEIALYDVDRVTIYSPAAEIDNSAPSNGYQVDTPSPGQSTLTCVTNAMSEASEAADATRFEASDAVKVLIRDPVTAGSAQSWSGLVISQSGDDVVVDFPLTGFDGTAEYIIIADDYTTSQASQKSDCYQAEIGDYRIQDLAVPYEYGQYTSVSFSGTPSTELPERHSTDMYGDGIPLSVAFDRALARMVNNFIDYKGAPQMGEMIQYISGGFYAGGRSGAGPAAWEVVWCEALYYGPGDLGSMARKITIAPMVSTDINTDGVQVRVTLTKTPPSGGLFSQVFPTPKKQLTFATSSSTAAVIAAQSVDGVYLKSTGIGYLTVEIKGGGSSEAEFFGLPIKRMGPRV